MTVLLSRTKSLKRDLRRRELLELPDSIRFALFIRHYISTASKPPKRRFAKPESFEKLDALSRKTDNVKGNLNDILKMLQ